MFSISMRTGPPELGGGIQRLEAGDGLAQTGFGERPLGVEKGDLRQAAGIALAGGDTERLLGSGCPRTGGGNGLQRGVEGVQGVIPFQVELAFQVTTAGAQGVGGGACRISLRGATAEIEQCPAQHQRYGCKVVVAAEPIALTFEAVVRREAEGGPAFRARSQGARLGGSDPRVQLRQFCAA